MFATFKRQTALFMMLVLIIPTLAACGGATTTNAPTASTGGTVATVESGSAATSAAEATEAPEATMMTEATEAPEATAMAEAGSATAMAGEMDFSSLSGAINIDGSSTVEPLSLAVSEEFAAVAPGVNITVGRAGTGGGFERFCNGETDANDASRAINEKETAACAANGVTPVEVFLGLDGIAVVVNPENDFVQGLNYEQLKMIFMEGGATTWDQVDPSFPAEAIDIYAPDTDSGTYDFMAEELGLRGAEEEEEAFRSDYTASADDNTLVTGVEGSPYAIGFFGYAFLEQAGDRLKDVPVAEEGTDYVEPSAETVEAGEYPLSRPLFIYPSAEALQAKPQLAGFIQFYLDNVTEIIGDVGYFPGSDERYQEARTALSEVMQ